MTVRHLRVETPVLGFRWRQVVDLDDTDPLIATLIAAGRLTVVSGMAGPAQAWHATAVVYGTTAPATTGLRPGTVWVSGTGIAVLDAGTWAPITTGGAAAPTTDTAREAYIPTRLSPAALKAASVAAGREVFVAAVDESRATIPGKAGRIVFNSDGDPVTIELVAVA